MLRIKKLNRKNIVTRGWTTSDRVARGCLSERTAFELRLERWEKSSNANVGKVWKGGGGKGISDARNSRWKNSARGVCLASSRSRKKSCRLEHNKQEGEWWVCWRGDQGPRASRVQDREGISVLRWGMNERSQELGSWKWTSPPFWLPQLWQQTDHWDGGSALGTFVSTKSNFVEHKRVHKSQGSLPGIGRKTMRKLKHGSMNRGLSWVTGEDNRVHRRQNTEKSSDLTFPRIERTCKPSDRKG